MLLGLAGIAAAAWISLSPALAYGAVPEYRVLQVPSPQPQANANFGERLRALADVNDDGARDILISSSNFDGDDGAGGTLANSGRLYVFSGRTTALLRALEPPFPQAGAKFGFWSASLGDVDGDGAGDFVTSAPGQVVGGATVGQVYVFSGRTGLRLHTISPPESLGAAGRFGGDFGGNVIAPGDLTGDGITDFVATASGAFDGAGAAYAFNGRTGALLYKVSNPDAAQASSFGFGAAEIGDINGDGAGEYQVGAPRFDEGALADVGRSYVIDGRTGAVIYTLMDPEPAAGNRFGQADADGISLGDITGDGKPDIFVDSFLAKEQTSPSSPLVNAVGKAHLFDGATGNLISTLRDPAPDVNRQFGASNASAGDLDQDGRPDSLVSSRGGNQGRATVFGGPGLGTVLKVFEDPGDDQIGALFGTGLASPGDVNGDGRPDYYISARGADVGAAANVGVAYAFMSVAPAPTPAPPAAAPPGPTPGPGPGPAPPGPAPGLLTAKLALARATISRRDRVLDVLAPITSLASGRASVELHAAGRRHRFTAPVNSRDGRISFRQGIPKAQADLGTGILTIAYRGDADTRRQSVRLRAASQRADLRLARPTLADGRLRASGTISDRARGVVRVQIEYVVDGETTTLQFKAPISDGRWSLNEALSQTVRDAIARRTGTLHSYTLFTGYYQARIRGEMRSFQVLGNR